MKAYEKLLEPITIGTHQWRNRMVKAPSSAMSWDPGQFCNERIIGLYDAISKGGASAIILGGMICDDPATLIDRCRRRRVHRGNLPAGRFVR